MYRPQNKVKLEIFDINILILPFT